MLPKLPPTLPPKLPRMLPPALPPVLPPALCSPWAWLPPLGAALLLAALLGSGANRPLFLWLNARGHAAGNLLWMHLTMAGDGAVALALVLPLIRRAPRLFWALLIGALVAGLWTQLPKQFVDVPRPLAVFAPDAFYQAGPAYRRVSFPSGHAAAAFVLAGVGVMGVRQGMLVRLLLLALASLIGLSRIMLGVHWPVDVLWGMLGGWLGAWFGLALQARWRWRTTGTGGLLAGLGLMAVAADLLVSRHIGIPAVLPGQRLVAAVSLGWGGWEWLQMTGLHRARALRRLHARAMDAMADRQAPGAHAARAGPASPAAWRRPWSWLGPPWRLPWPARPVRREQKRGGDG